MEEKIVLPLNQETDWKWKLPTDIPLGVNRVSDEGKSIHETTMT
jgi:hypothetical protein